MEASPYSLFVTEEIPVTVSRQAPDKEATLQMLTDKRQTN